MHICQIHNSFVSITDVHFVPLNKTIRPNKKKMSLKLNVVITTVISQLTNIATGNFTFASRLLWSREKIREKNTFFSFILYTLFYIPFESYVSFLLKPSSFHMKLVCFSAQTLLILTKSLEFAFVLK